MIFQVDEYIQKLDSELKRFEEEMQDRASSTPRYEEESLQKCRCSELYFIMMLMCVTISLCVSLSGGCKNNDKETNYTTSEEDTYKTSKKKQIKKSL